MNHLPSHLTYTCRKHSSRGAVGGRGVRGRQHFLWLLLVLSFAGSTGAADPSVFAWQITYRDCSIHGLQESRVRSTETREPMFHLQFTAGNGTTIHLEKEITPALIIDELHFSVRMKANQPGPQLLAHVILPRDIDPHTKAPTAFVIAGEVYGTHSTEKQLILDDLPKKLEARLRALQIERHRAIDGREAFVDRLIINAYTGEGDSSIQLGMPHAHGVAHPTDTGALRELGIQRVDAVVKDRTIRVEGDIIRVDDEPVMVRAVDARGEDWQELRRMGFNTIRLTTSPRADDFGRAEQLGLFLIAPLPSPEEWHHLRHYSRSIIAWDSSEQAARMDDLSSDDPGRFAAQDGELWSRPGWSRPVVARAGGPASLARPQILLRTARGTDLAAMSGSSPLGKKYSGMTANWQSIATEPSPAVTQQVRCLGFPEPELALDPDTIEAQVIRGLQLGARGLCFDSQTPLAIAADKDRLRPLAIRCALSRIAFAEPWLVAGQSPVELPCSDNSFQAVSFEKTQGTLVLMRKCSRYDCDPNQGLVGEGSQVSVTLSGCSADTLAFRITFAGLEPLPVHEGPGGLQVMVANPGLTDLILATRDPDLVILAAKQCRKTWRENLQLELKLVRMMADETAQAVRSFPTVTNVVQQLGPRTETVYGKLGRSRHALDCQNGAEAVENLRIARSMLHDIRLDLQSAVLQTDRAALGNPLLHFVPSLTAARNLGPLLLRGTWQNVPAGSSPFNNLDDLMNRGWKAFNTSLSNPTSAITIQHDSGASGSGCLAMTTHKPLIAFAGYSSPEGQELASAWIESAAMTIPAGYLARIKGKALIADNQDSLPVRLMVTDSWGGHELSLTLTPNGTWQPFIIYRASIASSPLRITLALAGTGRVLVDEITTDIIPLTSSIQNEPAAGPLISPQAKTR